MMESRVLGPKTGPERRAGYQINIPPTAALQGLTCEKKTKSILVKEADLYSKQNMT